ncbi:trypsin-like peptidase domain-containing protein [Streptomyces prunicolor]|uniref:trypsin-like peptidase domain-containing protein n=1 Tax=Streptomyces prunicolor TaxID=67348 RepID=UPI002258EA1A|nr:HEAT repeat domain-containing protein [Streptomyces prunicolor]
MPTELLSAATVMLTVPERTGGTSGTGFLITPTILATCAHVVEHALDEPVAEVSGRIAASGRELRLIPMPHRSFRDRDTGMDLALLDVIPRQPGPPLEPVLLCTEAKVQDEMWTFGHPAGDFREGESATFVFEGYAFRGRDPDRRVGLPRLRGTPVTDGFSGSAVVSARTGAVFGMLATSDSRGSAHMIAAADILDRCPEAALYSGSRPKRSAWIESLTDDQIRAGGWGYPRPLLRAYLAAVGNAADAVRPLGMPRETTAPALSSVYVRQRAETKTESAGAVDAVAEAGAPFPAEQLFRSNRDGVLLGDAGAGKSSLLRMGSRLLAEGWQRDEERTSVPVLIEAAELVPHRPIPEALAAGVQADGPVADLRRDWPVEFFRHAPAPNARWLVLVDGLDEIVDARQRQLVLEKLARWRAREDVMVTHQFLVATRPLPDAEWQRTGFRNWAQHTLLPLDTAQLPAFAEGWFTALAMGNPGAASARFIWQVRMAGLEPMATVPLMAEMLCQLFADHPNQPLPADRIALYEAYVALRYRSWKATGHGTPLAEIHAIFLTQRGIDVAQAAVQLYGEMPDHIDRLALARHHGDPSNAVDLLVDWTVSHGHALPPEERSAVIAEGLRRSGLFTKRGDDFDFLHQTLLDFIAAQHIAADPALTRRTLKELFGPWWYRSRRAPPRANDSFTGFLLHALHRQGSTVIVRLLYQWASDPEGARLIAALAMDGAQLTPILRDAACDTIIEHLPWTYDGSGRLEAAHALAGLNDRRAADEYADLAATQVDLSWTRIQAAEALEALGDTRAADTFAHLATDKHIWAMWRAVAAKALARRGDNRAPAILRDLATESFLREEEATEVISALAALDDEAVPALLESLVADTNIAGDLRLDAAEALARKGSTHVAGLLARLATGYQLRPSECSRVLQILARPDTVGGTEALGDLATETAQRPYRNDHGLWAPALAALAKSADPHATDLLIGIVGNTDAPQYMRADAAEQLGKRGDRRGSEILAALCANTDTHTEYRVRMAAALARLADPRGADTLATIVDDPWVEEGTRTDAAMALADVGDSRASDALADVCTGRSPSLQAAVRLAELGDPRAVQPLAVLIERADSGWRKGPRRRGHWPPDTRRLRWWWDQIDGAMQALSALAIEEAAQALTSLALSSALTHGVRVRAAEELVRRGDPRGGPVLAALEE